MMSKLPLLSPPLAHQPQGAAHWDEAVLVQADDVPNADIAPLLPAEAEGEFRTREYCSHSRVRILHGRVNAASILWSSLWLSWLLGVCRALLVPLWPSGHHEWHRTALSHPYPHAYRQTSASWTCWDTNILPKKLLELHQIWGAMQACKAWCHQNTELRGAQHSGCSITASLQGKHSFKA